MRQDERGPWYLFTGLVLGILAGLAYAWLISPLQYTNTSPASLRGDFKDQYRALIAVAYLSNGDFARARARLDLLEDPEPVSALALQAELAQSQGRPASEITALQSLSLAMSGSPLAPTPLPTTSVTPTREPSPTLTPTSVVSLLATPTPTTTPPVPGAATGTPTPSITPLPTRTATPTQGAAFVLIEQNLVCSLGTASLIQVEAQDAAGQPVPGVEVIINWDGSEERFYTGLKPELDPGYADYAIQPGQTYQIRLADGGEPASGLTAVECEAPDSSRFWGSWNLIFRQP